MKSEWGGEGESEYILRCYEQDYLSELALCGLKPIYFQIWPRGLGKSEYLIRIWISHLDLNLPMDLTQIRTKFQRTYTTNYARLEALAKCSDMGCNMSLILKEYKWEHILSEQPQSWAQSLEWRLLSGRENYVNSSIVSVFLPMLFCNTTAVSMILLYGNGMSVIFLIRLFRSSTVALCLHLLSRPVNDTGERVTPSELSDHRVTHNFLGPCCLCAVPTSEGVTAQQFVEALIQMSTSPGHYQGEFVARCAQNRCGFLGELHNTVCNN